MNDSDGSIPHGVATDEPEAAVAASLKETERWFLRRGVPHYIESYDASTKVWTRAAPFVVVVMTSLAVLGVALFPSADSVKAAAPVVAAPLLTWIVGNLVRRKPIVARPGRVGPADLAGWTVLSVTPDLVRGEWWVGGGVLALLLALMSGAYVVTSYGVVPLLRWGATRLWGSLGAVRVAAARALPMLLLFVSFFFLTAETWQTFAHLEGVSYGLALVLFVAVGVSFVWSSLRPDIETLGRFGSWEEVRAVLERAGSPAVGLPQPVCEAPGLLHLSNRQRINSLLVAVGNQTILASLVAAVLGVFFLAFGFLVVDEALIAAWVPGHDPHVLFGVTVQGRRLVLTEELVRVSGFLATFSGFYFGVYSVTDPSFRQGLQDDSRDTLREAMAARLMYLEARSEVGDTAADD